MASAPGLSLPQVFDDDASLEGAYRLLNSEFVGHDVLLATHVAQTVKRCSPDTVVYAISDSTEFRFGGERRKLGRVGEKGYGFMGHFCIAVGDDGVPRGLLAFEALFRDCTVKGRRETRQRRAEADRESQRWLRVACTAEAAGALLRPIHLMDREADIYSLLAGLIARDSRFIIRVSQDRAVELADAGPGGSHDRLFARLDEAPVVFETSVPVSAREASSLPGKRKIHPPRAARQAQLAVSATSLSLRRPAVDRRSELPARLQLNYVVVRELNPPDGEEPIDWRLMTTEPIDTIEDLQRIVSGYKRRWLIEEFFKALKSGCGYEKTQVESQRAVLNLLALLTPIAWQLLLVRHLSRHDADSPASVVLSPLQLTVLRAVSKRPLPANPTAGDVLLAIAKIGGHITNNGLPGWQVLGRGFSAFLVMCAGYIAGQRQADTSDQS